jgi:hypothetical protein
LSDSTARAIFRLVIGSTEIIFAWPASINWSSCSSSTGIGKEEFGSLSPPLTSANNVESRRCWKGERAFGSLRSGFWPGKCGC